MTAPTPTAPTITVSGDLAEAAERVQLMRCRSCGGPAVVVAGRVRVAHMSRCRAPRPGWRAPRSSR